MSSDPEPLLGLGSQSNAHSTDTKILPLSPTTYTNTIQQHHPTAWLLQIQHFFLSKAFWLVFFFPIPSLPFTIKRFPSTNDTHPLVLWFCILCLCLYTDREEGCNNWERSSDRDGKTKTKKWLKFSSYQKKWKSIKTRLKIIIIIINLKMKSAWGLSRYYSGNGNLFIGERWKRKLWDFVEMLEIEDLISACGNDDDDDV